MRQRRLAPAAPAVGAVLLLLGAAFAGAAHAAPGSTLTGPGPVTVAAKLAPRQLPQREKAPVALVIGGSVGSETQEFDGHQFTVRRPSGTLDLLLDPRFRLTTGGLPACTKRALNPSGDPRRVNPRQAQKRCGNALIGRGWVVQEFPSEEPPIPPVTEPILLFNAPPKGDQPRFLTYVYLPRGTAITPRSPLGGAWIGTISRQRGRTNIQLRLPDSQGTAGTTTAFRFWFGKRWRDGRTRRSLLTASCPASGILSTRATLRYYLSGEQAAGTVPATCTRTR